MKIQQKWQRNCNAGANHRPRGKPMTGSARSSRACSTSHAPSDPTATCLSTKSFRNCKHDSFNLIQHARLHLPSCQLPYRFLKFAFALAVLCSWSLKVKKDFRRFGSRRSKAAPSEQQDDAICRSSSKHLLGYDNWTVTTAEQSRTRLWRC